MTLLERDLTASDVEAVILRMPLRVVMAVNTEKAVLTDQGEAYDTREEADAVMRRMDQHRPDNVYGLGPKPRGAAQVGKRLTPTFEAGKFGIWAGPVKDGPTDRGLMRQIREAMR